MVSQTAGTMVVTVPTETTDESGVFAKQGVREGGWGLLLVGEAGKLGALQLFDGAVVGRGPDASVLVADPSIGAAHARFSIRADGVYIEDLGSGAGTWVDGVPAGKMGLAHGNLLRLGKVLTVFVEKELRDFAGASEHVGDLVHGPRQRKWVRAAIDFVRARESFIIQGAPGVGKALLARVAAQANGLGDVDVIDARTPSSKTEVSDALVMRRATLVVLHLDKLDRATQVEAARVIKRTPGAMLIATLSKPIEMALADGSMAPSIVAMMAGRRITVPRLQDRREDIPMIARALCERSGVTADTLNVELLEQLVRGGWADGAREIDQMVREVHESSAAGRDSREVLRKYASRPVVLEPLALQQSDPEIARVRMQRALERAGGTIAAAARELRMSRQAFYREVKRLQVELPKRKRDGMFDL